MEEIRKPVKLDLEVNMNDPSSSNCDKIVPFCGCVPEIYGS